jgi:hypothetical protein
LAFAGTTLQDTAARNLEISSDIITFLDNSPIFNVRSSGASNPQLRLERNNGANNFVFDFRNNQDLYITSTHLTPRIFILEDRMTPDDYSQVATRDYIKNLLVGDVDQQAWDLVITNIINTIYGAADYVMGDAIARYVCGRFRLTRPVATGQAASDFSWTGSDCENIDYWDNVIELSCTTGMYLNSVTGAGSFTCTQWPASPATPSANVTATPIGFPAPYRFLEHCIIIGTNRAGDITCLRKRFYIRDTSCCTCACADPVTITNVCAALGGGGFYDPAVTNIVQCYGSTIAAMADDQATSATGQVYIAGPPPECGADHEFRIQDCDRTAASVQAE